MWLPRGREWEGDGVGSLGLADETGISGMNKQQGPTVYPQVVKVYETRAVLSALVQKVLDT